MKYNEFKDYVVAAAKENGLEEYELYYMESDSISAETMMHNIDGFSSSSDAGACFRCIYAGKMGYASTELFTEEEARALLENPELEQNEQLKAAVHYVLQSKE